MVAGSITLSGISPYRKSVTKITIKTENKNSCKTPPRWPNGLLGGGGKKERQNKIPVANSTKGYCREIFFPQYLHFPRKKTKERTGIRSQKLSLCLQLSQYDGGINNDFLFPTDQSTTTFKKEPTQRPKRIKNRE